MGRLTLNVLLSFAQFEREVTGERIRDKIAASKKKGMWMGGLPPLGLDVKDRKLVVNPAEAETVRHICRSYLALGSVDLLRRTLEIEGVVSKVRINKHGIATGGNPLARGALYHMLQNRLYIGEIPHKDQSYPGKHEAIIDQDLWGKVQAALTENRRVRTTGMNSKSPSLLAGLLFDGEDNPMTPSHAVRSGKRYRYYVSAPDEGYDTNKPMRLPAGDIEQLVQNRIRLLLTSPKELHSALNPIQPDAEDLKRLIRKGEELAKDWPKSPQHEIRSRLMALDPRIEIFDSEVRIAMSPSNLLAVLNGTPSPQAPADSSNPEHKIELAVKAHLRRSGFGTKLHIEGSDQKPDPNLIMLLVKAYQMKDLLLDRKELSIRKAAQEIGLARSYLTRIIRLTTLAPDITKSILNGTQPPELTARQLMLDTRFPLDWKTQRQKLGFE